MPWNDFWPQLAQIFITVIVVGLAVALAGAGVARTLTHAITDTYLDARRENAAAIRKAAGL